MKQFQGGFYWGYKELVGVNGNGALLSGFAGKLIKAKIQFTTAAGYHAHQPTGNTLAYGKGVNGSLYNFKWDDDVTPYNLSCEGYIPFEYYFGPSTFSLKHDSLFYQQARILIEEIGGIKHHNVKSKQSSITASKTYLCNGETATFTLNPQLSGVTYNWITTNPSLQIISGQGTSSITIQSNGASAGYYNISCQSPGPCYTFNASVTIHVGGYSSSDYPVSGPSVSCNNTFVYFSTNVLPGATDYAWFWPASNWTYISGNHTPYLALRTGTVSGPVGVRVANACDPGGSPAMRYVQVNNCGGWRFTVSPNPTNGNILVSTPQAEIKSVKEKNQTRIFQIKILDQLGNVRKQQWYPSGITSTMINTSDLIAGVYIIQAYNGSTWETTKFVKQ